MERVHESNGFSIQIVRVHESAVQNSRVHYESTTSPRIHSIMSGLVILRVRVQILRKCPTPRYLYTPWFMEKQRMEYGETSFVEKEKAVIELD